MDLNRLRYFLVLSETQHLRQASQRLSISPAALSKAVKTLEEEFNQDLIRPAGRGLRLTDEGQRFAARIRPLIAQFEALEKTRTQNRKKCRHLRLAVDPALPICLFSELHEGFFFSEPLQLKQMGFDQSIDLLLEGELDAIVACGDNTDARITHSHAGEIRTGLFGREILFANTPRPDLPFADYPGSGLKEAARFQLPTLDAALEFCAQGKAVAYVPEFAVRLFNDRQQQRLKLSPLNQERRTLSLNVYHCARITQSIELRKTLRALRLITQNQQ